MPPLYRLGCWLRSRSGTMFVAALWGRIGIWWSGPERPSIIFFSTSSTPENIQGTVPFTRQVCTQCGKSGSLWPARPLPLQSWCTRWVSRWDIQVAPLHCSGNGDSRHSPTFLCQRFGRNESTCEWLAQGLSSCCILCTRYLAATYTRPLRWRQVGSWGRCQPPFTCSRFASPPYVLGGGYSPTQEASILRQLPLWLVQAGRRRVVHDSSILLGKKDEPEVDVLPSAEVTLDQRHVRH